MRRRLLFLLCLPSVLFLPLSVYVYCRPGLTDGTIGTPDWVVARVVPGTPAARAGVQEGDRVVSWNGVTDVGNAMAVLIRGPEDAQHTVVVERGGVRHTVSFQMVRIWLPGERALNSVAFLVLLLCLIPGLLLWFLGKGSAPAEYAAALLVLAGTPSMNPGNWNSLGPLLQVYPFHSGEVLYVLSNGTKPIIGFLLIIFANSVGRPILSSLWKTVLGALMFVAILPPFLWAACVLWGSVPLWLLPSFQPLFVYQVLCSLVAMVLLFLQLRAVSDVNGRRRIHLLLAGMVAALLGTLLFNVLLILYIQWVFVIGLVGFLLFACFPAAVLYALLKHRLFDVSVIIRRGVQYALTVSGMALLSGLFGFFFVGIPFGENIDQPISELLGQKRLWLAFGVLGVALAKRNSINRAINIRFFRDAYDPREVHLEVARLLAKRDDLERDGRQIAAILGRAMHAEYGALLMLKPTRILLAGEPRELAPLPKTSRVPALLEITGKPVEVDLAERKSFLRQLPVDDQSLLQAWKAGVLAPVGDGKVEAILLLGEKLSEQPYSSEDCKLIQAVAMDFTAAYFTGSAAAQRRPGDRMRECPRCGVCYAEDLEVCSTDGVALLDSALSLAVAGRYRLQRRLGMGGMGVVYQATDSELGRTVAVKVIRPESVADPQVLERFRREARSAAALSHPNIVAVFDFGVLPAGGAFLVMEYLEGDTLRKMLPLPASKALEVLEGVVAALDTAHRAGVVHRDLKPDNVMIASGWVKVLDFGLAKNLGTEEETLTREGRLAGTVAYMAPEQLYGGTVDARSDIYALGVMAHEMLAGQRPSHGQSQYEAVRRAISSQPSHRQTTVVEFLNNLRSNLS